MGDDSFSMSDNDSEYEEMDCFEGFNEEVINAEIEEIRNSKEIFLEKEYNILSTDEITQIVDSSVRELSTIICLPQWTTRLILSQFQWKDDKVLEKFFSNVDSGSNNYRVKLFEELNIISKDFSTVPYQSELECGICYTVYQRNQMYGVNCGHKFCAYCWGEYLKSKILDESECQNIHCPGESCQILIDDRKLHNLLETTKMSDDVKTKYKKLLISSYVEMNPLMRWCPFPNCNFAVQVPRRIFQSVICKCGHGFCFSCGELSHEPISCRLLQKWIEVSNEELKSVVWINKNTRRCPNCKSNIEKNGGCNHMTCRICKTEFCWQCMKLTRSHSNCNDFRPDTSINASRDEILMQRYKHYRDRYMNHKESLKFETEQYKGDQCMEAITQDAENRNITLSQLNHIKTAIDTLLDSRRTLMNTYVFSYFLETNNNEHNIFKENQRDLEMATERLSNFLDVNITNIIPQQSQLIDKYKYCQGRSKILLEHLKEGLENNYFVVMNV